MLFDYQKDQKLELIFSAYIMSFYYVFLNEFTFSAYTTRFFFFMSDFFPLTQCHFPYYEFHLVDLSTSGVVISVPSLVSTPSPPTNIPPPSANPRRREDSAGAGGKPASLATLGGNLASASVPHL